MKIIYLECNTGAAGDMLMAALLELYEHPEQYIDQMNRLGIPDVKLEFRQINKNGIQGGSVKVLVNGREEQSEDITPGATHFENTISSEYQNHPHISPAEIKSFIYALPISEKVKADAAAVYELLAQAEAKAHNRPVGYVHFHDAGCKDAIIDIIGCCQLLELLAPDKIVASPVCVGSGYVKCKHGILPVPAPATAILLQGIPIYGGDIRGELCTPTGAALLKYFVSEFAPMPLFRIDKAGYGMGQKELPVISCVRAFLGEDTDHGDGVGEGK